MRAANPKPPLLGEVARRSRDGEVCGLCHAAIFGFYPGREAQPIAATPQALRASSTRKGMATHTQLKLRFAAHLVQRARNIWANYLSEFPSAALSSIDIATAMPHSSALQLKIHPAYFWSSYFVYDVLAREPFVGVAFHIAYPFSNFPFTARFSAKNKCCGP